MKGGCPARGGTSSLAYATRAVLPNGLEAVHHQLIVHPALYLSTDYNASWKPFGRDGLPFKCCIPRQLPSIRGDAQHYSAALAFCSRRKHAFFSFGVHSTVLWRIKPHGGVIGVADLRQDVSMFPAQFDDVLRKTPKLVLILFRKLLAHCRSLMNGRVFPLHKSPDPPGTYFEVSRRHVFRVAPAPSFLAETK